MPVLSFTAADVLATTVIDAGKYPAIVCSIEARPSKEKTSTHLFTTFRIVEGNRKGKELTIVANTKTSSPSLLGGFGYMVPTAVFLDIQAAILNQPKGADGGEIDTDSLLNKPLDIIVTVEAADGVLTNVVKGFRPYKSDDTVAF